MSVLLTGSNFINLTGFILHYITLDFERGYAIFGMKTPLLSGPSTCLGMDAFPAPLTLASALCYTPTLLERGAGCYPASRSLYFN